MVAFAFGLLHRLVRVAVGFGLGRLLVVWDDLIRVIIINDRGFDGDLGVQGVIKLLCGWSGFWGCWTMAASQVIDWMIAQAIQAVAAVWLRGAAAGLSDWPRWKSWGCVGGYAQSVTLLAIRAAVQQRQGPALAVKHTELWVERFRVWWRTTPAVVLLHSSPPLGFALIWAWAFVLGGLVGSRCIPGHLLPKLSIKNSIIVDDRGALNMPGPPWQRWYFLFLRKQEYFFFKGGWLWYITWQRG